MKKTFILVASVILFSCLKNQSSLEPLIDINVPSHDYLKVLTYEMIEGKRKDLSIDSVYFDFDNNFVDCRGKPISIPFEFKELYKINCYSSEDLPYLFYMIFPKDIYSSNYKIYPIKVYGNSSIFLPDTFDLKEISFFNLSNENKFDSTNISLILNDSVVFNHTPFVFDNIDFSNAVKVNIPIIKTNQRVQTSFVGPFSWFEDIYVTKNIFRVQMRRGILTQSGVVWGGTPENLFVFFTSFPKRL